MHLQQKTEPFIFFNRCLFSPLCLLVKLFPAETGTKGAWEAEALEMVSYNCFRKVSTSHKIWGLPKCASHSVSPSQILICTQNKQMKHTKPLSFQQRSACLKILSILARSQPDGSPRALGCGEASARPAGAVRRGSAAAQRPPRA